MQVVSLATNAYEVREESRNKMMALKEKAKKDLTHYTQQIKEYQRRIDHEQSLQDFMKVKEEERTGDFEVLLSQKKEEAELKEKDDILMTYEEAFSRIREITELYDINEIVKKLVPNTTCSYIICDCYSFRGNSHLGDQMAKLLLPFSNLFTDL